MISMIGNYLGTLATRFGDGWNRFWFAPSDPFTLGMLRIALGVLLLYLHASYTPDLVKLFGPNGMVPSEMVVEMRSGIIQENGEVEFLTFNPQYLSILNAVQSPTGLYVIHALGAAILVAFTVGFKSRWACVLAWLLTLSYMHRAPYLISAVEPIVCLLLFYLCIGPCGACLSVDRWLANRRAEKDPIFARSLASRAKSWTATISLRLIQVHISAVYVLMGLAKLTGPPEVPAGSRVDQSVAEWRCRLAARSTA